MSRIVKVKNTTNTNKTWQGQLVASGTYFEIPALDIPAWASDPKVFGSVSSGTLLVNDGTIDFTDSLQGWKWLEGVQLDVAIKEERHTTDGKLRVLSSHKPTSAGTTYYNFFSSKGDHPVSGTLSEGNAIMVQTTSGESSTYIDLKYSNMTEPFENVYAFGGSFGWENAGWGDCFSFEIHGRGTAIVPRIVATGLGLDVDYKLDDDKIYYAGPDLGDYALGDYPTWIPAFDNDGHWNLDKVNLVPIPAASGTGQFNWHTTEQHVGSYISDLLVYKSSDNLLTIDATESAALPYGHWFRLLVHNNSGTEWKLWGFLKMYRTRLK
jgi:hypothetical protein